ASLLCQILVFFFFSVGEAQKKGIGFQAAYNKSTCCMLNVWMLLIFTACILLIVGLH
ncbi:hypothetical protein ACJX0J_026019, partial [Zea mays]